MEPAISYHGFDDTYISGGEYPMEKVRRLENSTLADLSMDLPDFVTARQIRLGKQVTEEILRDPALKRDVDLGIAELRRGDLVARRRGTE
jgi:hypothetical protein